MCGSVGHAGFSATFGTVGAVSVIAGLVEVRAHWQLQPRNSGFSLESASHSQPRRANPDRRFAGTRLRMAARACRRHSRSPNHEANAITNGFLVRRVVAWVLCGTVCRCVATLLSSRDIGVMMVCGVIAGSARTPLHLPCTMCMAGVDSVVPAETAASSARGAKGDP
jgi:hypothetical protein